MAHMFTPDLYSLLFRDERLGVFLDIVYLYQIIAIVLHLMFVYVKI